MIKTYVDWNVMSGMKKGHFAELTKILEDRVKFLLVYSTSHVGDILASYSDDDKQKAMVDEDLNYITHLTNNLCLANDSKMVNIHEYDPKELLQDRLDEAHIFEDFSIDNLLKPVEGDERLTAIIESYKAILKSLNLDVMLKQAFDQPESAEVLDKLFPGFRDEPTMNGLFKSFGRMYNNMNNTEDYKHLREMVQKVGVNSSHFSPGKQPFELIESAYGEKGMNIDQYFEKGKNAPEWFDEITNEYLKLDLHGYKADKIKVTEKEKNTFRNMSEDAFHSAFASRCEFYITSDDKNYHKTKAVYEKLGIFTKVLKPQEFIAYYNAFLNFHTFGEHYSNLISTMQTSEDFHQLINDDGSVFGSVCYPLNYFFNFFNKITLPYSPDDPYFLISKESPSRMYIITGQEIEAMVKMFVDWLGADLDGKTHFERSELVDDSWEGRRWRMDFGELRLRRLNGWFQLYFYLDKPISSDNHRKNKKSIWSRMFEWFKLRSKIR